MHEREREGEREREEGKKHTQGKEGMKHKKIGMKKYEEQMKEEKKHPHVSLGMLDRASSGKWELVLNKQTKIY